MQKKKKGIQLTLKLMMSTLHTERYFYLEHFFKYN